MRHENYLVVTQAAKLLLRVYQKCLAKHAQMEGALGTDQACELVFKDVTAFLGQFEVGVSGGSGNTGMIQNLVICACALSQVLSYLLSCACLSLRHGEKRI